MTTLDARGKSCPMPIVLLARAIRDVPVGEHLLVQANDRAFPQDVEAWCKKTGNLLVKLDQDGAEFSAQIRRNQ